MNREGKKQETASRRRQTPSLPVPAPAEAVTNDGLL
jgi:hypothetical protein